MAGKGNFFQLLKQFKPLTLCKMHKYINIDNGIDETLFAFVMGNSFVLFDEAEPFSDIEHKNTLHLRNQPIVVSIKLDQPFR